MTLTERPGNAFWVRKGEAGRYCALPAACQGRLP